MNEKTHKVWSMEKTYKLGVRCIFSFLNPVQKMRKGVKLRITHECFNKWFVFVKGDITKEITNMWGAKLNLAAKIFHVDSFVVFSSTFLLCGDLKLDLMFFIQLIWWIRTHQIFEKFDQAKMFQILLYT